MYAPSPVLSGTISQNSASATTNVDPRRYSQWDRSASQVDDASMSFGDFLDMINPLQHIPVISSVYREITGDKINPVSRIAGDVLYGIALGPATAIISGISAVADSAMEEKTGHDVTGTVYAALFGDDKEKAGDGHTMVAANTPPAAPATASQPITEAATKAVAENTTPSADTSDTTQVAAVSKPTMTAEQAAALATPQQAQALVAGQPVMQLTQQQGIPLNRNKLPFGGAMAPTKSIAEQNMAMAITQSTGMHVGNTIYPNRIVGTHGIPAHVIPKSTGDVAAPTPTPTPAATEAIPVANNLVASAADTTIAAATLPATPVPSIGSMSIPPALADDASILKALSAYRNTAAMGNDGAIAY